MTDKNRARLRQFDNPANVAALVSLGPRIFAEAGRHDRGGQLDALRFMRAFTVTLMLNAPIRTCGTTVDPEGERRSTVPFATAIKKFVKRETGIDINVHLFRHLAAKLYLQELSHDIETVRRILGHSSTATTVHAYADVQTASAFRRYDEVIASLQEQATALPKRKARARAGALA